MEYRVFISHTWKQQTEYYYGLERLLRTARRFDLRNLSVPRQRRFDGDYDAAKPLVYEALGSAHVVLVVSTPSVTRSSAVRDELDFARTHRIPIVVVAPPTRHGARNRSALLATEPYQARWTTASIVSKIRQAVDDAKHPPDLPASVSERTASSKPVILFPSISETKSLTYEPVESLPEPENFGRAQANYVLGDDEAAPSDVCGMTNHSEPIPKEVINVLPAGRKVDRGIGFWIRQVFGLSDRHLR